MTTMMEAKGSGMTLEVLFTQTTPHTQTLIITYHLLYLRLHLLLHVTGSVHFNTLHFTLARTNVLEIVPPQHKMNFLLGLVSIRSLIPLIHYSNIACSRMSSITFHPPHGHHTNKILTFKFT